MIHEIKIQKQFAEAVLDGRKTFEVRENDRGYQAGDQVVFKVMDGELLIENHALNRKTFDITYVLNGWGIKNNYVVFGIKRTYTKTTTRTAEEIAEMMKMAMEIATDLIGCTRCPVYEHCELHGWNCKATWLAWLNGEIEVE